MSDHRSSPCDRKYLDSTTDLEVSVIFRTWMSSSSESCNQLLLLNIFIQIVPLFHGLFSHSVDELGPNLIKNGLFNNGLYHTGLYMTDPGLIPALIYNSSPVFHHPS